MPSQKSKIIANNPATRGIKTASSDSTNDDPASTVETTGFAKPAVVVVEAALVTVVPVHFSDSS